MNPFMDTAHIDTNPKNREMIIQVYKKYRTSIFNYIFYRVGDSDLADDLTSDVFVKFVDKYDRETQNDRPIAPWLYTVAKNLITDHFRRSGRIRWEPLKEETSARVESNPLHQTETRLSQDCLMVAMNELTEDQRQVILLKFIEKRTNQEVGEILGKPEGAIKALQHRALAGLRRALEKESCYES